MRVIADVFAAAVLGALRNEDMARVRRMVEGHKPGTTMTYIQLAEKALADHGITDVAIHLWDDERIAIRATMGPVSVHSADGHVAVIFCGDLPDMVCSALIGRSAADMFDHPLLGGMVKECGPAQTPGLMKAKLHNHDVGIEL